MASDRASVLIYGSCVARDTTELMQDGQPRAAYVARQSLISAFSAPSQARAPAPLASAFQQRMLDGDLASSLRATVRHHAGGTALLLVDLVDERNGVYRLGNGSWVTNTAELRRSGILGRTPHSALVELGSDRHFELWRRCLDRFVALLDEHALTRRTVVIEAPFASDTAEGDALPPFAGISAEAWNAAYTRYYTAVRDVGLTTVRIPDELATSTREHRWGPAPYHYVEGAYRAVLDAIDALQPGAGRPPAPGATPAHG